jgi:hypothetical protein
MSMFIIIHRDSPKENGAKGNYVLANLKIFLSKQEAEQEATLISSSLEPLVIEGNFRGLLFPEPVLPFGHCTLRKLV